MKTKTKPAGPGFTQVYTSGWRLWRHTQNNTPETVVILAKAQRLDHDIHYVGEAEWVPKFFVRVMGFSESVGMVTNAAQEATTTSRRESDFVASEFLLTKHRSGNEYYSLLTSFMQGARSGQNLVYDLLTIRHRKLGAYRGNPVKLSEILSWLWSRQLRYGAILISRVR